MEVYPENSLAIAIDVDAERILGALVDREGNWYALEMMPIDVASRAEDLIAGMIAQGQRLQRSTSQAIAGIGISVAAIVNAQTGTILDAGSLPDDLSGIALQALVAESSGLPVLIENSANAIAYAEYIVGAGKDCDSIFYIHVGKIIDGAIINHGAVWRGRNSGAGQIANLVADWMGLKPITLSQKASGAAIAAEYNVRSRKFSDPTLPDIIQFAAQGDQLASRVLRDGARLLGSVLSPVVRLIDPQRVIVGGELAQIGALWWTPFEESLLKDEPSFLPLIDLQPALLQDEARMIGVGLLVHARQQAE